MKRYLAGVAVFCLLIAWPVFAEAQTPPLGEPCDPTLLELDPRLCGQTPAPATTPAPSSIPPSPGRTGRPPTPGTTSGNSGSQIQCDTQYNEMKNGLCLPKNPLGNNLRGIAGTGSVGQLISRIVQLLLYFAGIIAVVFIIIGGYYYMTARGNSEQAGKGMKTLQQAVIGLVIIILSYVIVTSVTNFILNGTTQ